MTVHGDMLEDFAQVKVKNAALGARNPYVRYRKEVAASAVVADPLPLLDICATSDGGEALVLAGMDIARRNGAGDAVGVRADLAVTRSHRRPAGPRRPRGPGREPGPVRARVRGGRRAVRGREGCHRPAAWTRGPRSPRSAARAGGGGPGQTVRFFCHEVGGGHPPDPM